MSARHHSVPTNNDLKRVVTSCRELIETRFLNTSDCGAAAVLIGNGSVITGTSPDFPNPSTTLCHETEPYLAAFRLDQPIVASLCLHRKEGRFLVLSPCGICQERLAMYGARTLVGVPDSADYTKVQWVPLETMLPHYWRTVFD